MERLTFKKWFESFRPDEKTTTICVNGYTQICEPIFTPDSIYPQSKNVFLVGEAVDKLAAYEDAEEQGLLLRLSCNTGDAVYLPLSSLRNPVEFTIEKIEIYKDEIIYVDDADNEWNESDFGKTIFITKEEAKAALMKM